MQPDVFQHDSQSHLITKRQMLNTAVGMQHLNKKKLSAISTSKPPLGVHIFPNLAEYTTFK
jgi:hypothetical protein